MVLKLTHPNINDTICGYMMGRCNDLLITSISQHNQMPVYLPDTVVRVVEYLNTLINTTLGIYDLFLVNDYDEPCAINWNSIRFYIHQNLLNLKIIKHPLFDIDKPLMQLTEAEVVFWLLNVTSRENRIFILNGVGGGQYCNWRYIVWACTHRSTCKNVA